MELYLILLGAVVTVPLVAALMLVRYVPNDRIGVVEKRFSGKGSIKAGLIALNGEAGFAPTVLRGGFHWLNRVQYRLHIMPLVTITQGKIGYVFARDGAGLEPTQTLASNRGTSRFEDVEAFLREGGQRGPQRTILREGTYAINLAQFAVITEERVYFLPLNREETAVFQEMATLLEIRRPGFDTFKTTLTPKPEYPQVVDFKLAPAGTSGQAVLPKVLKNSLGMELRLMPLGEYDMGSNRREPGRRSNELQRHVALKRPFYLASMETTNAQFRRFREMCGLN